MNIVPWINTISKEHDEIEKHKAELGLLMRDELPTLKLFPDIDHPRMLLGQWNNNRLVKYYLVE